MAATADDTVLIRQIQGLAVLLSCLPPDGKAREFFALALDSPHDLWQERVTRPDDPDSGDGLKTWLETVWSPETLSEDGRRLQEWQADSDNMTAALAEFGALAGSIGAG